MSNFRRNIFSLLALSCAAAVIGCAEPGNFEPHYRLNSQGQDRGEFRVSGSEDEEQKTQKEFNINSRQYLADALEAMFGTPDHPYVFKETGLDLKKIRMASGPAGGLPQAEQKAALADLKKRAADLTKVQPEQDTEAKKWAATMLTNLTTYGAANNVPTAKTPADLKDKEAAFREQFKSVFEAQAAADKKLGETNGELADLDMRIKSYSVAQKGLYRKHCAHCHGTTGDGAGPTAAFLNPYPRDYRQGIFKFKATERASRPSTADLKRILLDGINDTAMPSFALLPSDEVDALVEYVRYLAIRGEAESALKDGMFGDGKVMKPSRSELVTVALALPVEEWKAADESQPITPTEGYKPDADRTAWLKGGETLFLGDKAKCFSCHGVTALGDGRKKSEPLYDIWNKAKGTALADIAKAEAALAAGGLKPEEVDAQEKSIDTNRKLLATYDLSVQTQQPRNLRLNKFRFGRGKLDLYRRIFAGINGTEMPAGGKPGPLSEKEIWQLVDYVSELPYELNTAAPAAHGGGHAMNDPHALPVAEKPSAEADRPAGR